jgi:signal transduction histidine kinase
MELLAGIHIGWSVVYLIIGAAMAGAWLRSGRDASHLLFAVLCAELLAFSVARAVFYVQGGSVSCAVPGRVYVALLPVASATMMSAAARRLDVRGVRWRAVSWTIHAAALALAAATLAGWTLDSSHVVQQELALLGGTAVLEELPLTGLGYVLVVFSLSTALLTCGLLVAGFRDDLLVRMFFVVSFFALTAFTINDVLLQAGVLSSVYLVEHGIFIILLAVFSGFMRESERYRLALERRSRQLERANERLEKLAGDLDDSVSELDRVTDERRLLRPMADLGHLSASLAHEIRNPLAVLSNVASTLRRHRPGPADGEEYESLVSMLQEETARLARLVDDLLLFSQSGRLSRNPVDPAALVDLAVGDVREMFPGSHRMEVRVEEGLPPLPGSMDGLRRALVNLLVNAVQSSPDGGTVRVVVRAEPDRRSFIGMGVEDEAGGIPEKDMRRIFEPFFSTRPTGTGLGLSIVKSIVEAHDGDIRVENRPGRGAAFWLSLPLVETRTSRPG